MLKITSSEHNGDTVLAVAGRLTTQESAFFEKKLLETTVASNKLVLNFDSVPFVSSSTLRVLLETQRRVEKTGGYLKLTHISPLVRDVLNITGFNELLHVDD